jgi:tRNA-Thr(GGU) m(6)t(6)A37 methyltransferase TsaA
MVCNGYCKRERQGELQEVLDLKITYEPIGYVESEYNDTISRDQIRDRESRIILDPQFLDGLKGLEPRQRLMVLFHFDRVKEYQLHQHPRGDPHRIKKGVFAIRSPRRPNPIGVTVVEILLVDGHILTVKGLDAFDGSPVLDLKPVINQC